MTHTVVSIRYRLWNNPFVRKLKSVRAPKSSGMTHVYAPLQRELKDLSPDGRYPIHTEARVLNSGGLDPMDPPGSYLSSRIPLGINKDGSVKYR